jgi:hypothetical protein
MDSTGLTASDVALLNNDGMGSWNGMIWLFAILALMGGGFGNWGNNGFANAIGYENLATSNEVQRGFDNQNSMANEREILSAVNSGTAQAVAATNQTFHDTVNALQDKYGELQRDVAGLAVGQANLLAKQNECCCETKMLIQQTSADTDLAMANMEARLSQKLDANKIDELQRQVDKLQLEQATSGMLRFPSSWSYGAGPFPPIFGGCNCQGNI